MNSIVRDNYFQEEMKQTAQSLGDHRWAFLLSFSTHYPDNLDTIQKIYDEGAEEIRKLYDNLCEKNTKSFKKKLQSLEYRSVKIIQNAHITAMCALIDSSKSPPTKVLSKAKIVARGGWKAKLIFLRSFFSKECRAARNLQSIVEEKMNRDYAQQMYFNAPKPSQEYLDTVEHIMRFGNHKTEGCHSNHIWQAFENRRKGVIISGNHVYATVSLNPSKIRKQLESFQAQRQSQTQRSTLTKALTDGYTSRLTPFNQEFHSHFGQFMGNRGISSNNRQENHLVNGSWSEILDTQGTPIASYIRHGVLSAPKDKDQTKRKEIAQNSAKELVSAAVLAQLKKRNPAEIQTSEENPAILTLNSVSLLTPDAVRKWLSGHSSDERKMLEDQIAALFANQKEGFLWRLEIDGRPLFVKVKVNAFNFGVNRGAIHPVTKSLIGSPAHQYQINKKALPGLEKDVDAAKGKIDELYKNENDLEKKESLQKDKQKLEQLMGEIKESLKSMNAYLRHGNQYDVGSRILNLTNECDKVWQRSLDPLNLGAVAAFNCKSGKDRTGAMDGYAKTLALMAHKQKAYPSPQTLKKGGISSREFVKKLQDLLLEGGGLEITKINTDAPGYKNLIGLEKRFGLPKEVWNKLKGLSTTVKS